MLAHAEQELSSSSRRIRRLRLYIQDEDGALQDIAARRGYARGEDGESMSHLPLPAEPPDPLPTGFRLKGLDEDDDLRKADRVLWRGFGHGDEPPEDGIEERRSWCSAPNYRKELNVVVEAPDGTFVSYCGTWFEPVHRIAYVEPVATDPDYRRMGLARAAVLEGIRRCADLGARTALVGATLPVYLSIGFRKLYACSAWEREWM
jgi:ribosomal protein S18 acetylase RimI-like enzyme